MTEDRTLDEALPRQTMKVYEVFRQEEPGGPMVHAGQVQAPNDDLAPQYAREGYGRRAESVRLWVVSREHVLELADLDLLQPQFDRSYKSGKGYRVAVEKRRAIREKLGTLKPSSAPEAPDEDGHA